MWGVIFGFSLVFSFFKYLVFIYLDTRVYPFASVSPILGLQASHSAQLRIVFIKKYNNIISTS